MLEYTTFNYIDQTSNPQNSQKFKISSKINSEPQQKESAEIK
jgi:hypothetical protein